MARIHALVTVMVCASAINAQAGLITFGDGAAHIVDADNSFPLDRAVVQDSTSGDPTTVTVKPGGVFGDAVNILGTSIFVLDGGALDTYVQGGGNAQVQVFSGTIGTGVSVYGNANGLIMGGTVGGGVTAAPGGVIDIYGGSLNGALVAGDGGVINVYGTGFNFPLGALQPVSGSLTGTLADGTALSVTFNQDFRGAGTIVLVPEPTSLVNLLLIGFVLVTRRLTRSRLDRETNTAGFED